MTDTRERTERIIQLRNDGRNLKEIGDEVGLTRERVRQILHKEGIRTLSTPDRVSVAADAWRASGELRHPIDVAREHKLPTHTGVLAQLRRECPQLVLPETKRSGSRWSAESIAEILRRIAGEQGLDLATDWMRIQDYGHWRSEGDPSPATIGANYLWSDVMREAGFDPNGPHNHGRKPGGDYRSFGDADLDKAVLAYLDSQPAKLSAVSMEDFLMAHPELPSMATIRNRFRKRGIGSISGIFQDVVDRNA